MISEINAQYNIYVGFNATNIPTFCITRCHISCRSRCTSDLSSEVAILHFLLLLCLGFCCLLLSFLHLTSQTWPVKHCGWYYNVISSKLLQLKFLRLPVSDVLSKTRIYFLFFAQEQIICGMSQVLLRKKENNDQMKDRKSFHELTNYRLSVFEWWWWLAESQSSFTYFTIQTATEHTTDPSSREHTWGGELNKQLLMNVIISLVVTWATEWGKSHQIFSQLHWI